MRDRRFDASITCLSCNFDKHDMGDDMWMTECDVCGMCVDEAGLSVWGSSGYGRTTMCDTCVSEWTRVVDLIPDTVARWTPRDVIACVHAMRERSMHEITKERV